MDKEDFEFKPLTEGLGFYSKAERIKGEAKEISRSGPRELPAQPENFLDDEPLKGPGPAESSLRELMSKLPPSLDFEETSEPPPRIFQPLPRESFSGPSIKRELKVSTETAAPSSLKAPFHRKEMEESLRKAFPQTELSLSKSNGKEMKAPDLSLSQWQPTPTGILATVIDMIMITLFSFFCVLSLIAFADVDLLQLVQDPRTSLLATLQLAILLLGVSFIYHLAARSLAGQTLGDWAFDMRLGTPAQQSSWTYPLQVLWRHFVFLATGIILLPILSVIARRDLGRYLTGLGLFQRKN